MVKRGVVTDAIYSVIQGVTPTLTGDEVEVYVSESRREAVFGRINVRGPDLNVVLKK